MKEKLKRLRFDDRGQVGATDRAVDVIVGIMVAALTAAYLVPVGIDQLVGVDTSSWSGAASELWGILGLTIVLGVFLILITIATERV